MSYRPFIADYNEAIELIGDLVNQACLWEGKICHDFLSSYEWAFRFLGIEGHKISQADFWKAVEAKKIPEVNE